MQTKLACCNANTMYFTEHVVFLTELFRLNLSSNEGNIIFCDNDSRAYQCHWL